MNELVVRVRAPFAAFRWLQAGVYRATSPVIPPSAAWGLLLNMAAIDSRGADVKGTTTVRPDAPALEIAVAALAEPETAVLYQQLHSYPVGNSGKEFQARTHGAKYWIAPARREVLVGFDCLVAARGPSEVLHAIRAGLRGDLATPRYGLLHAGDNNLLVDRVDVVDEPPPCRWFARLGAGDTPRRGSCRLTIGIDRADSSGTTSATYAPLSTESSQPPPEAWTWVPRAPA